MRVKDFYQFVAQVPFKDKAFGDEADIPLMEALSGCRYLTKESFEAILNEGKVVTGYANAPGSKFFQKGDIFVRRLAVGEDWTIIDSVPDKPISLPKGSSVLRPIAPDKVDEFCPPELIVGLKAFHGRRNGPWDSTASALHRYNTRAIKDHEIPEFLHEEVDVMRGVLQTMGKLQEARRKQAELFDQLERSFLHRFSTGKSIKQSREAIDVISG